MKLIWNFLRNRKFLFYRCLKIVFHQKSFLQRSESQIRRLSKLRVVLVLRTSFDSFVEHRILIKNILLIYLWNGSVGPVPSFLHYLGVLWLVRNWLKLKNLSNFFDSIGGSVIGGSMICWFGSARVVAIFSGLRLSFVIERSSFFNSVTFFHFYIETLSVDCLGWIKNEIDLELGTVVVKLFI